MMKSLADRIELILHEKRWSAAELARQAKVSRAAVSDWRNGNVISLNLEVAVRVARAAEVDPMWVATGEGDPVKGFVAQKEGSAIPAWPFKSIPLDDFEKLSAKDKRDLETTVARFIAGCLAGRRG